METLKPILRNLIAEVPALGGLFKRNILKDYLQVVVLDFIYSDPRYSRLIFYGITGWGTAFNCPGFPKTLILSTKPRE